MKLKKTIIILLSAIAVALLTFFLVDRNLRKKEARLSLPERAVKARTYAQRHGLNTNYAIFVDYGLPSGTPRLFIWDFNEGKVVSKIHVMHGCGGGSTDENPVFSNKTGSNCSSLGKFEVTRSHGSKLKRSYRVKGLEASNSNAWNRGIMIHSAKWVDVHKRDKYVPLHEKSCKGCFTVSSDGMRQLARLIEEEDTPILLWSWRSAE